MPEVFAIRPEDPSTDRRWIMPESDLRPPIKNDWALYMDWEHDDPTDLSVAASTIMKEWAGITSLDGRIFSGRDQRAMDPREYYKLAIGAFKAGSLTSLFSPEWMEFHEAEGRGDKAAMRALAAKNIRGEGVAAAVGAAVDKHVHNSTAAELEEMRRSLGAVRDAMTPDDLETLDHPYRLGMGYVQGVTDLYKKYHGTIEDERRLDAYRKQLADENQWAVIESIKGHVTENARNVLEMALESADDPTNRTVMEAFGKLSTPEMRSIAGALQALHYDRDPNFKALCADAGRAFMNTLESVTAGAVRGATDLLQRTWMDGAEYRDMVDRRVLLEDANRERMADWRIVGNAVIGAASTIPYMAAAAVPYVGMADMMLTARDEFQSQAARNGVDVSSPDFILGSSAFAIAYAYVEKIQWEKAFGGIANLSRRQMYCDVFHSVRAALGVAGAFAGTVLTESGEEGIQAALEEAATHWGQGTTLADEVKAFTEDFVGSLGTMAIIGAFGGAKQGLAYRHGALGFDVADALAAQSRILELDRHMAGHPGEVGPLADYGRTYGRMVEDWINAGTDVERRQASLMRWGLTKEQATAIHGALQNIWTSIEGSDASAERKAEQKSALVGGGHVLTPGEMIARIQNGGYQGKVEQLADGSQAVNMDIAGTTLRMVVQPKREASRIDENDSALFESIVNELNSRNILDADGAKFTVERWTNLTPEQRRDIIETNELYNQGYALFYDMEGNRLDGRVLDAITGNVHMTDVALPQTAFHETMHGVLRLLTNMARGEKAGDGAWKVEPDPAAAALVGELAEIFPALSEREAVNEEALANAFQAYLTDRVGAVEHTGLLDRLGRFLARLFGYGGHTYEIGNARTAHQRLFNTAITGHIAQAVQEAAGEAEAAGRAEVRTEAEPGAQAEPGAEGEPPDAPTPTAAGGAEAVLRLMEADYPELAPLAAMFRNGDPLVHEQMASLVKATGGRLDTDLVWAAGYRWNGVQERWEHDERLERPVDERDRPQQPYMGADGELQEAEARVGAEGLGAEAARPQVASRLPSPEFAMDGTIVDALPAHLREDGRAIVAERGGTAAWMVEADGTPTELNEREWLRREAERRHGAGRYAVSGRAPTAEELAEAQRQYDEVVAGFTKPDGTKKAGWLMAPNGKPTRLTEQQWVQVRTENFRKNFFGDWLALADCSLSDSGISLESARKIIETLKGREFTNEGANVTVRLSSDARGKLVSNKAAAKSRANGFTNEQHNEVAARVGFLFQHAERIETRPDRKGDPNILSIQRYVAPVRIGKQTAFAWITVKESKQHGAHIYSVEEIKLEALARKVGQVGTDTTHAASASTEERLRQLAAKVNPDSVSKVVDENGEPLVVWHGSRWNPLEEKPGDAVFGKSSTPSQGSYLKDRQGFFFANKEVAEGYGVNDPMAFFINAREPYTVDVRDELRELDYDIETEREEAEAAGYPIGRWLGEGDEEFEANDSATAYLDDNMSEIMARSDENRADAVLVKGADGSFVAVVFDPTQIKSATDNVGTFDSANPDIRYQIAGLYTGSAADYANRRPDGSIENGPSLHHIGSGEGSQVYGWGLYASDRRGVAQSYAKNDAKFKSYPRVFVDGEEVASNPYSVEISVRDEIYEALRGEDFDKAKGEARLDRIIEQEEGLLRDPWFGQGTYAAERRKRVQNLREALNLMRSGRVQIQKNQASPYLYEQTFFTNRAPPEETERHLLKWYDPASDEQKAWILAQLEKEGRDNPYLKEALEDAKTGQAVYELLAEELVEPEGFIQERTQYGTGAKRGDQSASEFLARAGIDGVKYPVDSYLKRPKDGDKVGWNYVSFRDDNIRVDHKWVDGEQRYQIAGALGAGRLGNRRLADAEAMERSGATREDIWRETGWWRGADGTWRVEIADIRLTDDWKEKVKAGCQLRDIMSGPVIDAYDNAIGGVWISVDKSLKGTLTSGVFNLRLGTIRLNPTDIKAKSEFVKTLAHEVQHTIQQQEGFALGTSLSWQMEMRERKVDMSDFPMAWWEYERRNRAFVPALSSFIQSIAGPWLRYVHDATIDEKGRVKFPYETKDEIPRINGRMIRSIGDIAKGVEKKLNKWKPFDIGGLARNGDLADVLRRAGADELGWFLSDALKASFDEEYTKWATEAQASYAAMAAEAAAWIEEADAVVKEISRPLDEAYNDAQKAYNTAGGEIEARMVEARLGLSDEQRMEIPPWVTEEVVSKDTIATRADYSYEAQRATMERMANGTAPAGEQKQAGTAYPDAGAEIGDRRFSVQAFADGTRYVHVDTKQKDFDGKSPKEQRKAARRIIMENFQGRTIGIPPHDAYVDAHVKKEYVYPAKWLPDQTWEDKLRASPELGNLMLAGEYKGHEDDDGRHPEATGGWDKYETIFEVGGRFYTGTVSIMRTNHGRVFYALTKLQDSTQGNIAQHGEPRGESLSAMDTPPQSSPDGKPENGRGSVAGLDPGWWDVPGQAEAAAQEGRELARHGLSFGGPAFSHRSYVEAFAARDRALGFKRSDEDYKRLIDAFGLTGKMTVADAKAAGEALQAEMHGAAATVAELAKQAEKKNFRKTVDRLFTGAAGYGIEVGANARQAWAEYVSRMRRLARGRNTKNMAADAGLVLWEMLLAAEPEGFEAQEKGKPQGGGKATDADDEEAALTAALIDGREGELGYTAEAAKARLAELLEAKKGDVAARNARLKARLAEWRRQEAARLAALQARQEAEAARQAEAGEKDGAADGEGKGKGDRPQESEEEEAVAEMPDFRAFIKALQEDGWDLTNPGEFAAVLRFYVEDWLAEKNGIAPGDVMKDPVSAAEYRATVQEILRDSCNQLLDPNDGAAVRIAERMLGEIPGDASAAEIEARSRSIIGFIKRNAIRQSRKKLVAAIIEDIKKLAIQGKMFDETEKDIGRKITGERVPYASYVARILLWGDKRIAAEMQRLNDIISGRLDAYRAARAEDAALEDLQRTDREIHRATERLAALQLWGGLRKKSPAEIALAGQQIHQWLETERDAHEKRWTEWKGRNDEMAAALEKAFTADRQDYTPDDPGFVGMAAEELTTNFRMRLERLAAGSGAEGRRAIDQVMMLIYAGSERLGALKAARRQRTDAMLERCVEGTGMKVGDFLKSLDEPIPEALNKELATEEQPVRMTWGQALQLLGELEQTASYSMNIAANGRTGHRDLILAALAGKPQMLRLLEEMRRIYEEDRTAISDEFFAVTGNPILSPDPLYLPARMFTGARDSLETTVRAWNPFGPAFTPRISNKRDFNLSASIMDVYNSRMKETATALAFGMRGMELRSILARKSVQEAIARTHGKYALRKMVAHLTDIVSDGYKGDGGQMEWYRRAIRALGDITTYSALSWNAVTMLKQMTSIPAWTALLDGGYGEIFRHITNFDAEAARELCRSPGFVARYGATGFGKMFRQELENPQGGNVVARLFKAGMTAVQMGDFVPGILVGTGVYKARKLALLRKGLAEPAAREQAARETWGLIEENQQSSRLENTPEILRRGGFIGRQLSKFATSPMMQVAHEIHTLRMWLAEARIEARHGGKESGAVKALMNAQGDDAVRWRKRFVNQLICNHVLMPAAMYAIATIFKACLGGEPPDKEEIYGDLLMQMVAGPWSRIFLIGAIADQTGEWVARMAGGKPNVYSRGDLAATQHLHKALAQVGRIGGDVADLDWASVRDDFVKMASSYNAPIRYAATAIQNAAGYDPAKARRERKREIARREAAAQ